MKVHIKIEQNDKSETVSNTDISHMIDGDELPTLDQTTSRLDFKRSTLPN